jgi:hypothetical protein
MSEILNTANSKAASRKNPLTRTAAQENGPIVIKCKETLQKNQRTLEINLGVRHYKKPHRKNHFSILITRFQISADFHLGKVEHSEPTANLNTPLGEIIQRKGTSDESEHSFGPELSGSALKLLASLKAKRAVQNQSEIKRAISALDVLTTVPSGRCNEVTWLVKFHNPSVLAQFLLSGDRSSTSVLDYYVGSEQLKARATVDALSSYTSVSVMVDCDNIIFLKHNRESRFSAFWESVTLYEMTAKRQFKRLFTNYRKSAFIQCTLS